MIESVENIAVNHLLGPIMSKLGDVRASLVAVDLILNPGGSDISRITGDLKELLGEKMVKMILESAEEFRMCETIEEAMAVQNKFFFDKVA